MKRDHDSLPQLPTTYHSGALHLKAIHVIFQSGKSALTGLCQPCRGRMKEKE